MEYTVYKQQLTDVFEQNGLANLLDDNKIKKFYDFSAMLIECNRQFNLTAITEENDIMVKHFAECASISSLIPSGAKVIDVGCGAGFPSLPLAILREDIQITALDSTAKRIAFVSQTAKALNLNNVTAICARAEKFAAENRERFDICTSRAVARLNILSELCLPLVQIGGTFIAMKSVKGDEEYSEAKGGIERLGAQLQAIQDDVFTCGEITYQRKLLSFIKTSKTPELYPRKYSQILKKPL